MNPIKERRHELGITQFELAYIAGVSLKSVQCYEAETTVPKINQAQKLANALNSNMEVLFPNKSSKREVGIKL
jgi:DNA-binding XRE family transcriptional regulator